ncbi:acyltransferase family protein [Trinickia sp. YCB016]
MATKRNRAIDTFRGLGILLAVLGDTKGLPAELHRYIYSFHIPAFFLLSGYLFNAELANHAAVEYIRRRFARLIAPAWTIGAICGLIFAAKLVAGDIDGHTFFSLLIGTAVGDPYEQGNFLCSPLWFLFCLFSIEVAAAALTHLSLALTPFVLIAAGAVGTCCLRLLPFIAFDLHIAVSAALFFGLGSLARLTGSLPFSPGGLTARQAEGLCLTGAIWAALVLSSGDPVNMPASTFGTQLPFVVVNVTAAIVGALMLRYLALILHRMCTLRWLGRHTLPILGFNGVVNAAVTHTLSAAGIDAWFFSFVAQLVVLSGITWLLDLSGSFGDLINGRYRPLSRGTPRLSSN